MMDIRKTISSIIVHGSKDPEGRDFRTQLNIALDEVCSQAGFDVQKDTDGTNVTATLPWGTVLSINDLPTSPASNSLADQVILVQTPGGTPQSTLSNMAMKDTVGREVPNILIPLYFSYDATGTLKGLALPFYFSMSLGRTPAGTIVTDGVTDFYSCGNCIYIREEEK